MHQFLLVADSVAKGAAVSGDDLCGARGIEVEGDLWPCSALSRQFNRLCTDTFTDIAQMTSKSVEIVPLVHRQGNGIPSAAIR